MDVSETKLADEEQRLKSAKAQSECVAARMEQVKAELDMYQGMIKNDNIGVISQQDEVDLKDAFKQDIRDVFDFVLSMKAEAQPDEDGDGEDGDDEGHDHTAPKATPQFPTHSLAIYWRPSPSEDEMSVSFRVHDVYTFGELRENASEYFGISPARAELMELFCPQTGVAYPESAMITPEIKKGTFETDTIMLRSVPEYLRQAVETDAERKAEMEVQQEILQKAEDARVKGIALRAVAVEKRRSKYARSLLTRGVLHVAFTLLLAYSIYVDTPKQAYATKQAIEVALAGPFSRIQNWGAASLKCEQLLDATFRSNRPGLADRLKQRVVDQLKTSRMPETSPSAPPPTPKTPPPPMDPPDMPARRGESYFLSKNQAKNAQLDFFAGQRDMPMPDHMLSQLKAIADVETMKTWFLGPLLEALAPKCAYNGADIYYPPNITGSIAGVNLLTTPLHIGQSRRATNRECHPLDEAKRVSNFPLHDAASYYPMDSKSAHTYLTNESVLSSLYRDALLPPCSVVGEESTDDFGGEEVRGQPEFSYTREEESNKTEGQSLGAICGKFGSIVTPTASRCYGPNGYIKEVWAAVDYRPEIERLLVSDWVDEHTQAVWLQFIAGNMQTSCLVYVNVLFEISSAGLVQPSYTINPACQPDRAPKLFFTDPPSVVDWAFFDGLDLAFLICTCLYVLRILFVNYRTLRKAVVFNKYEGFSVDSAPFRSGGYWLDLILGVSLVAWLIALGYHETWIHVFAKGVWFDRLAYTREKFPAMIADLEAAYNQLVAQMAAAAEGSDAYVLAMRGLSHLKTAFFFSATFDGIPYGVEYEIDMRVGYQMVPFHMWYHEKTQHIIRSTALMACVFKALRYLQAWRPLSARYVALAQAGPQMARFFIVLLHAHFGFSMLAHLIFMFEVPEFSSFQGSFQTLAELLTGKVTVAQSLVESDANTGSVLGRLFIFVYIITNVLTCSSLILSVIVDNWENSTDILIKRRHMMEELKRLDALVSQGKEAKFALIKSQVQGATAAEVERMADAHLSMSAEAAALVEKETNPTSKHKKGIFARRTGRLSLRPPSIFSRGSALSPPRARRAPKGKRGRSKAAAPSGAPSGAPSSASATAYAMQLSSEEEDAVAMGAVPMGAVPPASPQSRARPPARMGSASRVLSDGALASSSITVDEDGEDEDEDENRAMGPAFANMCGRAAAAAEAGVSAMKQGAAAVESAVETSAVAKAVEKSAFVRNTGFETGKMAADTVIDTGLGVASVVGGIAAFGATGIMKVAGSIVDDVFDESADGAGLENAARLEEELLFQEMQYAANLHRSEEGLETSRITSVNAALRDNLADRR